MLNLIGLIVKDLAGQRGRGLCTNAYDAFRASTRLKRAVNLHFQLYLATIWPLQILLSCLSCKVTQTHTHNEYWTKETGDPAEMTCQHLKNGFGSKRFPMVLSSKCVEMFEEYNVCRKNTLHVEKKTHQRNSR